MDALHPSPLRHLAPHARVLVTGAAGGVGRHVVRALLDAGFRVRATDMFTREDAALEPLIAREEVLEWVAFNFASWNSPEQLVDGCAAVVHTAAIVSLSESFDELSSVNVGFTRSLYEWSMRLGVEHFVHMSCASVYRYERGVRSEDSAIEANSGYERTKIESEHAIRQVAAGAEFPLPWTVLRPGLLYGPYCTTMGAGIVTLPPILRGLMRYLPGLRGGPRTNWCHVEDVASSVVTVLGNPEAYFQPLNVADETPLSFGEVLTSMTEAYGLELGPVMPFPNAAIWSVLAPLIDHDLAFGFLRQMLRYMWRGVQSRHELRSPLRPRVDRHALFYVGDDAILLSTALRGMGWRPAHPDFRIGILETIRWYQDERWVPRFDSESETRLQDDKSGLGLGLTEVFVGHWGAPGGEQERTLQLNVDLEIMGPWRAISGVEGQLNGYVWVEGLASHVPVQGTVVLRMLPTVEFTYEFGFADAEGRAYRFEGRRGLRRWQPGQLLLLEGQLTNQTGDVIGTCALRAEAEDELVPFLNSLRLVG